MSFYKIGNYVRRKAAKIITLKDEHLCITHTHICLFEKEWSV